MKLEGIHHITAITGDAQKNVDFYAGVLGLRLVKKTVNQDDPTVYHLFFADEKGDAGSDLTFFEYPGAPPGRTGDGMIWGIRWRVGSPDALDFWAERLKEHGIETELADGRPALHRPRGPRARAEGRGHLGRAADRRATPRFPEDLALQGFDGAIAYSSNPEASRPLLEEALGFQPLPGEAGQSGWECRGDSRGGLYGLLRATARAWPAGRGQRPPHRLGLADRRARGLARARDRRRAPARRR